MTKDHKRLMAHPSFGDPARELSEADVIAAAQMRLEADRAKVPVPPYADPPRKSGGGKGKTRATRKVTLVEERRILELRAGGRSMREIAEVMRVCEGVIRRVIMYPRGGEG